jgi:hypothetical protein
MRSLIVLPLIKVYKLAPPDNSKFKEEFSGNIRFVDTTLSTKTSTPLFSDSIAITLGLDFIKSNLGKTQGELAVEKIEHFSIEEVKSNSPSGSVKTISFDVFYNHIRLNNYFALCYFAGQYVREANTKLPGKIEEVPGSVKEIISKEKAVKIFEDGAEKAFHTKYHADKVELIYAWYPIDNMRNGMDFSIAYLRPNWLITFSHGSELLVDAFDGKLWRDD